jgi:DNA-binding PadR family transcriptional regulator
MSRPRRDEMPDLSTSPLELDLLALCKDRSFYSREIEQALKEVSGRKRRFGSLYPTLHHLEKRGLLSAHWGDEPREERGGPRRRYYTTTDRGVQALNDAMTRLDRLAEWTLTS